MAITLYGRGWVNKVPFDLTQRTQRHLHYLVNIMIIIIIDIIIITDCQSPQGYEEVEKVDRELLTAF